MLRRIFGPEREKVGGGWRRLHNEEFHKVRFAKYYLGGQMKGDEMARACNTHGRDEKYIQNFGQKT